MTLRSGLAWTSSHRASTVSQGYRETAGHFVLLSRDPNIMYLSVLPKRGVHGAEGLDRLRAIRNQHITRV
ncbi:hypothetical protein ACIRD6_31855 [Streptomyces sp. NPDC102473]|uniref:hypothetical protein n=1 Tax=Streptomyces sp. NPDC102473 TaxID=3366180 RepID=UPI00380E8FD1